jgi:hypothetical protein
VRFGKEPHDGGGGVGEPPRMQDSGFQGPSDYDESWGASASVSSIVSVSVAVIWLDAKGVTLDTENRFPFRVGSPGPSGEATPGGPLSC